MNGKWLFLLLVCINIIAVISANTSPSFGYYSINGSNTFLNTFVIMGTSENTVPELNSTFTNNVTASLNANTASVSPFLSFGGFIDGIRLVLSLLALFTPIPAIAVFSALQFPTSIVMLFAVPFILLYILAFIEFIRGGNF